MMLVTFHEDPTILKAISFCCRQLSQEYHMPQGTIGLGSLKGKLRVFMRRNDGSQGVVINNCPFCGKDVKNMEVGTDGKIQEGGTGSATAPKGTQDKSSGLVVETRVVRGSMQRSADTSDEETSEEVSEPKGYMFYSSSVPSII